MLQREDEMKALRGLLTKHENQGSDSREDQLANPIRELLYFDIEKATSIWSQYQWGKTQNFEINQISSNHLQERITASAMKLVEGQVQSDRISNNSIVEKKIIHHDLLNRVERALKELKLIADFSDFNSSSEEITPESIRNFIGTRPFVMCEGWCFIEDFSRIIKFESKINEIDDYINRSNISQISNNSGINDILERLRTKERELENSNDSNKKFRLECEIKKIYDDISKLGTTVDHVEKWVIDGIRLWIDTFLKDRLIFRTIPFENCVQFQIINNLKKGCIVDGDIEYLISSYGTQPNIKISSLGLITALPPKEQNTLSPLDEFTQNMELSKVKAFEKALRAIFPATEEVEAFTRFYSFPNIMVEPIAIFRNLHN